MAMSENIAIAAGKAVCFELSRVIAAGFGTPRGDSYVVLNALAWVVSTVVAHMEDGAGIRTGALDYFMRRSPQTSPRMAASSSASRCREPDQPQLPGDTLPLKQTVPRPARRVWQRRDRGGAEPPSRRAARNRASSTPGPTGASSKRGATRCRAAGLW
jgi:hypothetical protein